MSYRFRPDRNKWEAARSIGGVRHRVLCESKKEAKQIDAELRKKQLACVGVVIDYSLKEAFASFIETESSQKMAATKKADAKFLEQALDYFTQTLHITNMSDVTIEHLQRFQIFTQKECNWSDTTMFMRTKTLRAVFRKSFIQGRIAKDPCEYWKVPRGTNKRRRAMTQEEFTKLMSMPMLDWLRPVLAFIRLTGSRGVSVADLRWSDVDFPKQRLYLTSRKGKLRHEKVTPFPIYDKLEAVLTSAREKAISNGAILGANEFVFTDEEGDRLSGHRISSATHRLIKEAGLEGVVLYSLRHALAVDLTEAGVPLEITRQLMGHSNISQTQTYAQGVSADSLSDSIKLIRNKPGEEK